MMIRKTLTGAIINILELNEPIRVAQNISKLKVRAELPSEIVVVWATNVSCHGNSNNKTVPSRDTKTFLIFRFSVPLHVELPRSVVMKNKFRISTVTDRFKAHFSEGG